ncbi:MAG: penicillin-binding Tp47 domain C-containing protein [Butyricicoccus sp.]|nr:penicillin-binding Tp47 domain C-containing protein [Butyricicoccus sp.]
MNNNAKKTLRVLSVATAATMMVGSAAFAVNADDIHGHWAEKTLQQFIDNGWIQGDEGGIRPDSTITRAEMATVVDAVEEYTEEADVSHYKDVAKTDWFYEQVAKIVKANVMVGVGDNKWAPQGNVTREQAAVIMCKLNDVSVDTKADLADVRAQLTKLGYTDANAVSDWAAPYILAAVQNGYMSGYPDHTLRSGNDITRAEAIVMLDKAGVAEEYAYVTMNVPYDDFYKAEGVTAVNGVDAVTSATMRKSRMNTADGLTAGTYYKTAEDEKSDAIRGVVCTVRVAKSDLAKLNASLTEHDDYYYTALDSVPENYKELTIGKDGSYSFGKTTAAVDTETLKDTTVTFKTSSKYGDYQMKFSTNVLEKIGRAYGATVTTTDGTSYAMRSLENVWNGKSLELAWSVGFTTTAHGNPLVSDDYVSMMGKTIKSVAFYTVDGKIYSLDCEQYVPVKFATDNFKVENALADSGSTSVEMKDFPKDYEAEYKVTDAKGNELEGASVKDGKISWTGTPATGKYTLTVSDKSGKYASYSTTFELQTSAMPAAYQASNLRVAGADGASAEELNSFLSNVSSVNVNGKNYSASGRGSVAVINSKGFVDLSTSPFAGMKAGDTYKISVKATGYAKTLDFELTVPDKIYAYANLSYNEYWANEGVYAAGNDSSSEEADAKGELDKGGFDAVSRATTNHGLHRGSFQQTAVITAETTDGQMVTYGVDHWAEDGSKFYEANGTAHDYSKGTITTSTRQGTVTATLKSYKITGIKYVPVAVDAADYQDFCKKYTVVKNGQSVQGGYGEQNLKAYTGVAAVDAATNGLKTVSKSGDAYTFSARQTGTGSGLLDQEQANDGTGVTTEVKKYSGSYGEFLRVDLNGTYGALGAAMQTVKWTYYGSDSTYTTPVATYGTKFAADNWMHKSNGIQLGLTDSVRCQLPEGTDGTGYWALTVYGLGTSDYTTQFQVTAENLPSTVAGITDEQKTELTNLIATAQELSAKNPSNKAALDEHIAEAQAMLNNADATQPEAAELIADLQGLIKAAQDELNKQPESKTVTETVKVNPDADGDFDPYDLIVDVVVKDGKVEAISLNSANTYDGDKHNKKYSEQAASGLALFGKTAAEVDGVDIVSGATCSSKAIKEAAKAALSE